MNSSTTIRTITIRNNDKDCQARNNRQVTTAATLTHTTGRLAMAFIRLRMSSVRIASSRGIPVSSSRFSGTSRICRLMRDRSWSIADWPMLTSMSAEPARVTIPSAASPMKTKNRFADCELVRSNPALMTTRTAVLAAPPAKPAITAMTSIRGE